MTEQHEFDFIISYTKSDEGWAEWIAWQLEAVKPPYTTFLQAWDFHAGDDWVRLMQQGTTKARRTIAVLSPEFLKAEYTQAEWQAAFAQLRLDRYVWPRLSWERESHGRDGGQK